ncbi:MAG: ribosome-recycling factor, partial [Bacteroidales bacterium]
MEIAKEYVASCKGKMENSIDHLEKQLLTIRAGKANTHVLDSVVVDYYDSPTPLAQVASITVPDARTIQIQPWEKPLIPAIERAIM